MQSTTIFLSRFVCLALLMYATTLYAQGIIIDHTAVERFEQIPPEWIIAAKKNIKLHYQHTSHGSQPIKGAERIATALYKIAREEESLPAITDALNIYEDTHPVEGAYWDHNDPIDLPALEKNTEINFSMWSWCCELNTADKSSRYLTGMENNINKYSNVTFIFMTGNAQSWHGHHTYKSDSEGYNRYLRNEEIRQYCKTHNKILFDFADIDCWYNGEMATSTYNGNVFPREHDHYNIDEAGHTSYENCENKAKAFWFMMAVLAGWKPEMTPVELVSFQGRVVDAGIELSWKTATERHNFGFEIERSTDQRKFETIAFINGNATSTEPKSYHFVDKNPPTHIVYYRLKQIDFNGFVQCLSQITVDLGSHFSKSFRLHQNYPNPFNPLTHIHYSVPFPNWVTIKVYDSLGKQVITLVDEFTTAGNFSVTFDASQYRSGEYFYNLKAGNFTETRKMIVVK